MPHTTTSVTYRCKRCKQDKPGHAYRWRLDEYRDSQCAECRSGISHQPDANGFGVAATPDCLPGPRDRAIFQRYAQIEFGHASCGDRLMPWAWIANTCETRHCLNAEHMIVHAPTKIAYPAGVCVYCGDLAGTRDHLLPTGKSGEGRRVFVATVPACGDCNSRINDFPDANIDKRRAKAHASISRSKRALLNSPTHPDLSEYGPTLRSYIVGRANEKQAVLNRLAWPEDPFYDIRAFEKSGIEDPVALGMCANPNLAKEAS